MAHVFSGFEKRFWRAGRKKMQPIDRLKTMRRSTSHVLQVTGVSLVPGDLLHENKKIPPHRLLHLARPYRIFPVPHRRDAHAVRPRTARAARQQHTDDWFVPLVDTAGIHFRDRVTSTTRWSGQTGQISGRATARSA